MGCGTLPEVQDWSGDTTGGLGRVGGPYLRSGTGRRNLPEVQDMSGDPPEGPGRVEVPF